MKRLSSIILTLLLSATLFAQQDQNPPAVRIANGPYLQAVGETEFTVVWKTTTDALAWVEIAPDDGTHFYNTDRAKHYETIDGIRKIGRLHKVRVTGLEPGTKYRYRIMQKGVPFRKSNTRILYTEGYGSDILRHKPYEVTTLDKTKDKVCFSVVNDMHEQDSILCALYKDCKPGKYDFILFGGDMTSVLNAEDEIFKYYMDSASRLFAASTPLYTARGNHEFRGTFAINWNEYFPSNSGHPYFAFRQGPVYFIILDSGEDKPDDYIRNLGIIQSDQFREQEAEWLAGIVEDPDFKSAPIRIVYSHMPPKQGGWHGESEVARLFMPILNKAGIDLMLCGHRHCHGFHKPGDCGNEFPIIVNPNLTRMDIDATAKEIDVRIFDAGDNLLHKHRFTK